jgi:hypothetical protein
MAQPVSQPAVYANGFISNPYTSLYTVCWKNFSTHVQSIKTPLVRPIGDYTMADLQHQYKKYVHKRTKHILF